jgi:hypothetical protein
MSKSKPDKTVTIKNVGRLKVYSTIKDGPGARITGNFLTELVCRFVKHSAKNVNSKFVASFAFGEMQMNSSFAPAVSDLSEAFLMEYPLYKEDRLKKKDPENSYGRIDYWIYYKNIDFYLELKHSRISTQQEPERKDIEESWEVVCRQADRAYDRSESEATNGAKGAVSIGLHVFTIYHSTSKNAIKASELFKNYDLDGTFEFYLDKLRDPIPNWKGILYFNNEFIEKSSSDLDKGRKEFYPGLLFMAHVTKLKEY